MTAVTSDWDTKRMPRPQSTVRVHSSSAKRAEDYGKCSLTVLTLELLLVEELIDRFRHAWYRDRDLHTKLY